MFPDQVRSYIVRIVNHMLLTLLCLNQYLGDHKSQTDSCLINPCTSNTSILKPIALRPAILCYNPNRTIAISRKSPMRKPLFLLDPTSLFSEIRYQTTERSPWFTLGHSGESQSILHHCIHSFLQVWVVYLGKS